MRECDVRARARFRAAQPGISFVVRLAAAGVMIAAGAAKMKDLPAAVRATRAYEILPEAVVPLIGNTLPFIEILLGFFLLLGLLTRWSGAFYVFLLATFTAGIIWAWAKGLQIDCGCFGGGGTVAKADYAGHLRNQAVYTALGVWLVAFPASAFSLDRWLKTPG
jgi:uncharacterized membrane protein YphA (DoxX/SURF4 family)